MHVISISLDNNICNKDSAAFLRMKEYASLVDEMHIACFTLRKDKPPIVDGNLFIYPTNSKLMIDCVKDAYKIGKKIIKENNFSKENSIITTQDPFETGLVGYLLKRKYGIGLNIQDHGNFFESASYFRKETFFNFFRFFLGKFILKRSDSVRTVSLREKEFIEKNFKFDPGKVINVPIFTNWEKISKQKPRFDIKKKYPGFDFYILTICRLEKVKNIPLLLDSFSEILRKHPKILLIIVGNGSQEKNILKKIRRNNLQKNVILEKWTDDPVSYHKTSDLFVLTSFSEGWGLTIVEAAASKCPVIMTDTGCANEFIVNGKNGFIVGINKRNDLKDTILDAIDNREKIKKLALNAFESLKSLPTKEKTLNLLKKSWENALNQ